MKNIEKLIQLIEEKEAELNIYVIEYKEDIKGDVHFLCKRESRGDYAIWSAYHSGDRAYDNFYNGFYCDSVVDAIAEYKERIIKDIDANFYYYSGFNEPELIAESLDGFKDDISIESNYLGEITNDVITHMEELLYVHYLERDSVIMADVIEDLKELLFEYNIFVNPMLEELQQFNESKCLSKNDYLTNFIENVA